MVFNARKHKHQCPDTNVNTEDKYSTPKGQIKLMYTVYGIGQYEINIE
jgi:hypothetical protein